MTWPMIVLAIGSVASGGLLAIGGTLQHWLEPVVGAHEEVTHVMPVWVTTAITLGVVAVGIAIAYRLYATRPVPEAAPAGSALTVAARKDLYGDAFNEEVFMRPGADLTRTLVRVDDKGIDGTVTGTGRGDRPAVRNAAPSPNRLRPLLCIVDVRRRRARRRRNPGGEPVVVNVPWLSILWLLPGRRHRR